MAADGLLTPHHLALELQLFASAVVHELRTPLSAVAGEIDLALRRDRPGSEYREALKRIADRIDELVDITGDLAFLAERDATIPPQRASLSGILVLLADRYAASRGTQVAMPTGPDSMEVVGDERLITRALTLLMEQGARHRHEGATVRLGLAERRIDEPEGAWVSLMLTSDPPGFSQGTWDSLGEISGDWALRAPGLLRLQAAAAMLRACGGEALVESSSDTPAVRIRLARASAGGGTA